MWTTGLGLLTSSNFFVPQVNVPGSMASFVLPATIPIPAVAHAAAKSGGLGQSTTNPPWWAPVVAGAVGTADTIALQQTNPWAPQNLPPGTYYQQTPGGTVVTTAGAVAPGTTALTTNLNSMMPLLLIAGGFVLIMSMARK
jgi:hypothetical protein